MFRIFHYISLLILSFLIVLPSADAARISKSRIEFNPGQRAHMFHIINNSSKSKSYTLDWQEYVMNSKGSVVKLAALPTEDQTEYDGMLWADDMLRVAPKRITVPPGSAQIVRVLLRPKKNVDPGEYRSHLRITEDVPTRDFAPSQSPNAPKVVLNMQRSITMPVIVRLGKLDVDAEIADAEMNISGSAKLNIAYTLKRMGQRSLYGDFEFICRSTPEDKRIALVRGIALYPERAERHIEYTIDLKQEGLTTCSIVDIIYRAPRSDPKYKGEIIATARVTL